MKKRQAKCMRFKQVAKKYCTRIYETLTCRHLIIWLTNRHKITLFFLNFRLVVSDLWLVNSSLDPEHLPWFYLKYMILKKKIVNLPAFFILIKIIIS